jgi:hypothetical protein
MPSLKEMAQGMRLVYDGGDGAIFQWALEPVAPGGE